MRIPLYVATFLGVQALQSTRGQYRHFYIPGTARHVKAPWPSGTVSESHVAEPGLSPGSPMLCSLTSPWCLELMVSLLPRQIAIGQHPCRLCVWGTSHRFNDEDSVTCLAHGGVFTWDEGPE